MAGEMDREAAVPHAPAADAPPPPAPGPDRRVSLLFALFFYGFLALAGAAWLLGTGGDPAALFVPRHPVSEAALGLGAGILLAGTCGAFAAAWRPARDLEREFGWILGSQGRAGIVVLALLSGFAEELFFRGAMLAAAGPVVATLVFAALHWPVNRSLVLWPVFALLAGAVLAAERILTGGLVAPVVTHATVNLVNLWRITDRYRDWIE